jgi:hypothetical protein
MIMIELIISKDEEDIIKREVHGEVEEVIVEDVFVDRDCDKTESWSQ